MALKIASIVTQVYFKHLQFETSKNLIYEVENGKFCNLTVMDISSMKIHSYITIAIPFD